MLIKKKEKPTQNLAYIGIMAAINIIAVLLSNFVPALIFVLVFFLPLSAALVSYLCKGKYIPIFIIVTLVIAGIINLTDTLFYVLPAIISGTIFGLIIDKNIDFSIGLALSILLNIGLTYFSTWIYNLIFERNIIEDLLILFNLSSNIYSSYYISLFVFLLSLSQMIITSIVLKDGFKKLNLNKTFTFFPLNEGIAVIVISVLAIIASIVYVPLAFQFILLTFVIIAKSLLSAILSKNYLVITLFGTSVILSIFLFALLSERVETPLQFLSFNLISFITSIGFIINKTLAKKKNKVK